MSLLIYINPIMDQLKELRQLFPQKLVISTTQKVVVVSVTTSVALLGILARYMKRKKQIVDPLKYRRVYTKRNRGSGLRSPNGDVFSQASSGKRSAAYSVQSDRVTIRQGSVISERTSLASGNSGGIVLQEQANGTNLTPQQLGVMGMEALETSINYWEDALAAYRATDGNAGPLAVLGRDEASFCRDLQNLLEAALELQERSEALFLDERSVLFHGSVTLRADDSELDAELSGGESFASAQDQVADLREFDEFTELFPDLESLPLYQTALRQLENGGIPCRSLRTEVVKCGSDCEYLAKLHCIRLAFQHLLREPINYAYFTNAGRQILADLLLYADKDPKDFLIAYETMLKYVQDGNNWREIEEELSSKGVKALNFYDIVMDYILMDAFEDLETPPVSVLAVVQNRWLSKGFKETALATAVWSILKAKRRFLRFPNGFMAHFCLISGQLSPLLAWGFLGPDESLKETCAFFKEQVMGFLADIFNFQKSKFVTVETLAEDVLINLKQRVENICQRLSPQS